MRFTDMETRIIRLALSHYAYAQSHEPKQQRSNLIAAADLCYKIDKEVEDTKKNILDYRRGVRI